MKPTSLLVPVLMTSVVAAAEELPVYYDYVEHGRLAGGRVMIDTNDPADRITFGLDETVDVLRGAWAVTTITDNGPSSNRVDLVILGDGYTAGQLDTYALHTDNVLASFLAEEPFWAYERYFNVHRVDVISNESGVDEPGQGLFRDTALDMTYGCGGIDRLLCVSVGKAITAAASAPDVDQILALANSTHYGGAGYPGNDIGTLAGANSEAIEIALHEFGHAFGDLADEYVENGGTYTGPEAGERNLTIHTAAELAMLQTKWYRWLNLPNVDAFEGAGYYAAGLFRPTFNSRMRSLNRPYEEVNVEALVINLYKTVSPIDAATPTNPAIRPAGTTFFVLPMQPLDHDLDLTWKLDGVVEPSASGMLYTPDYASLLPGIHDVFVTVVDNTTRVRDEEARDQLMTKSRAWQFELLAGDCDIDADTDLADYARMQQCYGAGAGGDPLCDCFDVNDNGSNDAADAQQIIDAMTGPVDFHQSDCNDNGIPDEIDVAIGNDEDCNGNQVPDSCEFAGGSSTDCNEDGIPDHCQLIDNDCDGNEVPDDCQFPGLIAEQPAGVSVCPGDTVVLNVTPSNPAATLQWQHNGMPLADGGNVSGATTAMLTISNAQPADAGPYTCLIGDGCLVAETDVASVVVIVPATVSNQPATSLTRCSGQDASFVVGASGVPPFTYEWYKDGESLGVHTVPSLVLHNVDPYDSGDYRCVVSNSCGSEESDPGTLVILGEGFEQVPQDLCVEAGGKAVFTAESTHLNGVEVLWAWHRDGALIFDDPPHITGTSTDTLTISDVTAADAAAYEAVIGTLDPMLCINESPEATLTVGGCP